MKMGKSYDRANSIDIPAGNVTAKATKDGQTSDASAPKKLATVTTN